MDYSEYTKQQLIDRIRNLENRLKLTNEAAIGWHKQMEISHDYYKTRVEAFASLAKRLPEPFRTLACDIIVNGAARWWGVGEGIVEPPESHRKLLESVGRKP